MLSCKKTAQLVSQGMDRRMGLWERAAVRLHLAICDGCTNFKRQAAFIQRAMKRLAD
jgi:hypothetical protein